MLFYKEGASEQRDYVGYPKSQDRKVADPGIKPLMTSAVTERGCQADKWSNAHFHLPTCQEGKASCARGFCGGDTSPPIDCAQRCPQVRADPAAHQSQGPGRPALSWQQNKQTVPPWESCYRRKREGNLNFL